MLVGLPAEGKTFWRAQASTQPGQNLAVITTHRLCCQRFTQGQVGQKQVVVIQRPGLVEWVYRRGVARHAGHPQGGHDSG